MDQDTKETPELPLEMVVHILSFLHPSDRREASLVCRSWCMASQDLRFQKNITFRFPATASSVDLIRGLGRMSRCNLIISQLDGFSVSRLLLLEVGLCLGSKLQSFAMPGSSITETSLLALLPRLTSLRRLDLRGLDSLFMSGAFLSRNKHRDQVKAALSGLEELDLSDLRYLSNITFGRLTDCTPRLRRLSLAGCHIAFQSFRDPGYPIEAVDRSSSLSLSYLQMLLMEQKSTLVSLDLSRTSMTPVSLRAITQVQGLVLEELCLHGSKELTDYAVEVLVKHQPNLQKLDISACPRLTNRAVEAVVLGLKTLTHLSLSHDWRITEDGLTDLLSVSSLRSLDLSECLHINGTEMVNSLERFGVARAQLETLSLKRCPYIRDSTVFSLAQFFGNTLRELDLTSCVNVTDLSLRSIATWLKRLVVLRLGWCKEITDWGLLGMEETRKCEADKEMGDKGPRFTRTFGNMGFFMPPPSLLDEQPKPVTHKELLKRQPGTSLLALRMLQELDLSGCPKVTDSSITQVVRYPDLRHLSLSTLPEITDASLASVAQHCRSLTSLTCSHCSGISDHGVAQAAPYLHRLQHLCLSGCGDITDKSLFLVVQQCKRLRTLHISRCQKVSAKTVDLLQSQLPFLEISTANCLHSE
ncbi:uncharacterized protein fbxl9 [Brachionichthys hirsutus]|uniref:uncharacterized protein fbxl9 n=1 Tax=Brachionichthys hirsutus TaxID=412623 RepID=UPI0036044851